MLNENDVLKLAKLSRLELNEKDASEMVSHLGSMLEHMEELRSLDLSNVEPMTSVEDGAMVLREDIPEQGLSAEDAFKNAPEEEASFFVIPKVIGG